MCRNLFRPRRKRVVPRITADGPFIPYVTPLPPVVTVIPPIVVPPVVAAPVFSVAPAITGTAQDGQTLSATNGTASGSPSFALQWRRNGTAISGATSSIYLLVPADVGSTITITSTATNAGGSVSSTSSATGTVIAAGSGTSASFIAPGASLTSSPTAYPPVVTAEFYTPDHQVGDTLRIKVYSAITMVSGVIVSSGSLLLNTAITLASSIATNQAAINSALSGIASGVGYVFLNTERGSLFSSTSIPVQYGTAATPAVTSSLTPSAYANVALNYVLTLASPAYGVVIRGQDGDQVEFSNAVPGTTFNLQFIGNAVKTYPADDYDRDNSYDIAFEVIGLNGVHSSLQTIALALAQNNASAFTFPSRSNAADATPYTARSTTITIPSGTPLPISVTGGTYSLNSGPFVSTPGTFTPGDTLDARGTSGTGNNKSTTVSVTVGTTVGTFLIQTPIVATMFWSGSDKNANVALSGSPAKLATLSAGGTYGLRSSVALPNGDLYWEYVPGASSGLQVTCVGIANSSAPLTAAIGSDANAIALLLQFGGGDLLTNNTHPGPFISGGVVANDVIGVKLHNPSSGSKTISFNKNNGLFFTDYTFSITGSLYIAFSGYATGDTAALRIFASELTGSIPSGYSTIE